MMTRARTFTLGLIGLLAACDQRSVPSATVAQIEPAIAARYNAQCAAIARGDYQALVKTVGERYTLRTLDGRVLSKRDALGMFVFPLLKPQCSQAVERIEVRGDWAVVERRSSYVVTTSAGMPGTGPIVRAGERFVTLSRDTWALAPDGTPTLEASVMLSEAPR